MRNKKGFTLIEFLLYIVIAAAMMSAMSAFLTMTLQSRVKNQTIAEVEQVGSRALSLITQAIRNAEIINSPTAGSNAASLSLGMTDAGKDPTIFDISGSVLQITEGAGSPVDLSSSRVVISGLDFENLSQADTPGIIRVEFTVTHTNFAGRQEYSHSATFTGSASLR